MHPDDLLDKYASKYFYETMSEIPKLYEIFEPERCKPSKQGRVRSSLFVLANAALVAAAAYFMPHALAENEIGSGKTILQYGQTVENAIASVCLPQVGRDGYDVVASIQASQLEQDGKREYVRFSNPHSGATIIASCISKEWPFLNNRSLPDMVAIP